MKDKTIPVIYYITLIVFSGAMSLIGLVNLALLPHVPKAIEQLKYPGYLSAFAGIYIIIGVINLWLIPVKFLKKFTYAGFFILLGSAIFSHTMVIDSVFPVLFPGILLLSLGVNYFCNYLMELNKQKNKYLMYIVHKKIKDNDSAGEMSNHYSDCG